MPLVGLKGFITLILLLNRLKGDNLNSKLKALNDYYISLEKRPCTDEIQHNYMWFVKFLNVLCSFHT